MGKPKQPRQSRNHTGVSDKPPPTIQIIIAVIAALGFIIVALINRTTPLIPIQATQTAEALHTSLAMTTLASLTQPTNTLTSLFTIGPTTTGTPISIGAQTNPPVTPIPSMTDAGPPITANADGLTLVRALPGTNALAKAAISSDGEMLALTEIGGTIRILSTREDRVIASFDAGTVILSLAFSKDNQMLAAGLSSTTVKVWRLSDSQELNTLEGLSSAVYHVEFSHDGQLLAASARPNIMIWRVSDGTILQQITGTSALFDTLAFSPDRNLLASGLDVLGVRLWQVADAQMVHDLKEGNARVLAFAPNGEILATGGQGSNVNLWRVRDGALVPPALTGHTQNVESLAFSADGETLVTASRDIEVRRWRITDGNRQFTLKEDGTNVRSVLLSADGQTLMALYQDGTVKIWHVPSLSR